VTLEDLRARARNAALTPDDIHMIAGHLQPGQPARVRALALEIATEAVAVAGLAELVIELIAIAESRDPADDDLRPPAVRALAKTTAYKGQPLHLDL
jgi:hypothetical protein